jgi:hypothetical protein
MIHRFFYFLDTRPWAPWLGLATCVLVGAAIDGTNFPFSW